MAKQKKDTVDLRARDITNSVIAAGRGARASKNTAGDREQLREAKVLLAELRDRLSDAELLIEDRGEIRDEVDNVRNELDREKPNFKLLRAALRGIKNSLGPAETLARLAAQVLDIVKQHG
jgi:hypothetical protein